MTTAQLSQRQTTPTSKPSRVNSVFLGVSGGMSKLFLTVQGNDGNKDKAQFTGDFGQAEAFVFVTENITLGADFAYHYFFWNNKYANFVMPEVLITGAFYLPSSSLNPHLSLSLGYYGEPHTSHFGMVPGIGIMPKIANRIYFKAKGSAVFFNIGGYFFKLEAGFAFMVFQHKPLRKY
jgi:hypothetical protein